MRLNLGIQFGLAFLLVLLLPAFFVSALVYRRDVDVTLQRARDVQQELIKVRAQDAEYLLQEPANDLHLLSTSPSFRKYVNQHLDEAWQEGVARLFQEFLYGNTQRYTSIEFIDSQSRSRIHLGFVDGELRVLPPSRQSFGVPQLNQMPVPALLLGVGREEGTATQVNYGLTVFDDDGVIVGNLYLSYRLEALNPFLDPPLPDSRVYVVEEAGGVVLGSQWVGFNRLTARRADAETILGNTGGSLIDTQGLPDQLQVFARIQPPRQGTLRYTLIAEYPIDALTVSARRAVIRSLSAIAFAFIVGLGLAFFFAYSLSTPIKQLTEAAEQIRHGVWNVTLPERDGRDEIGRLSHVFNDMVRALKQREDDLETTLNSIGDGVISTDREGLIVRVNPQAESLLLRARGVLLGQPLAIALPLFDGHSDEALGCLARRVMDGAALALRPKTILKRHDGTTRVVACNGAPIRGPEGETMGAVLVIRDITDEQVLLEQLQHTQRLESIGQLAGGVAHDFNNMLTAIGGYAELLERQTNLDKVGLFSQQILLTTQRAADLTRQLLTFSRRTPGRSEPVDFVDIITEVENLLHRTLDRKVRIELHLDALHTTILGDATRLQSCLLNLGVNAGDAMPQGGQLVISTQNIELDPVIAASYAIEHHGSFLQIRVTDNGCGIPEHLQHKVFDPFFTTKVAGKGTGLGLSMAHSIVRDHGGLLTLHSQPGKGTEIQLLLPVVAERRVAKAVQESVPILGMGRILVVEDEEIVRDLLREQLELLGYSCVLAQDGVEGLRLFREDPSSFDVVLLDMVMPNMDGLECFDEMYAVDPRVKAFMVSGFTRGHNEDDLKARGLLGLIHKPFDIYDLSVALNNVLKEQTMSSVA